MRLIEDAVRRVRAGNPLLPVAVVVPSHLLGHWLNPRLFADTGHLAIDFVLLPELAWRAAEPKLLPQGRGPVPENVDLALLLATAAEAVKAPGTPDYLRDATAMRGFGPAALRTLHDLASAQVSATRVDDAAPKAVDPERLKLLARLARGLEERLAKERLVDRASLYDEAARALPSAAIGGVVVCDDGEAPPSARAFLDELKRTHPTTTVALRQEETPGEAPPTTSLARTKARLFGPGPGKGKGPATPLDDTVTILAAAGEGLEAVEIARAIRQATKQGLRHQEIAVFLHDTRAYAAHLASAFERAGIDGYFLDGVPRVDPAARALGLLLDLVGGDLDRRAVMEFLTTAQVRWEALLGKDARISPANWDRLSAEAGIVSGLESWRERLKATRNNAEERQWDDQLRMIDSLGAVIERLAADLARFPEEGGWAEFERATLQLLDTWIERGALTRERLERILGPLAAHAPRPTRDQFLSRVRELIATQTYREGELADERVLVAPIAAARGLSYRLVFVPGLVERSFPPPARPDPLLLDEERAALSKDLETTRDAAKEERLLFKDAVATASERIVLSYPRFDTASGRARFPSSFLLQAAEAATGARVTADDLGRMAKAGETGLGRAYPREPDKAIDRIERDLALVASGVPGAAAHLHSEGTVSRAIAQERAASQPGLTPYDGLLDLTSDGGRLDRLVLAGQQASASKVETLAGCPYRHLLARGFGLRKWQEPDHVYQVDGRTWGSLYHSVVQRLFEWLRDEKALPLKPSRVAAAEKQVARIVDEVAAEAVARGDILNPALIEPAKGRLRMEVAELLEREADAAADGFVPIAFEQHYEDLPIEIAPGRTITFSGYLDRIDQKPEPPTVRVIDYKTGKYNWKDGEQFRGGRELQLALYNEALRQLYPHAAVAEARYYFATSGQRFKTKACPATEEIGQSLRAILDVLEDTARAGVFAPVPDDPDYTCAYCDFSALCGQPRTREGRFDRKKADPRLAAFLAIRGIA